ncbi:MAG: zf-HC2 domain-containing protein [Oscillospiraceae bacterium]|nr:zf-HC2 domain-containing protein [Oscillospiraceae bacterium]
MSRCEHYQELISRLIDGDLDVRERAELDEHIRGCADCSAVFSAFAMVSKAIGDDLEEVPLDMHESIMCDIRREELRKRERLPSILRVVLAAAACLAVIVGLSLGFSPTLRDKLLPRAAAKSAQAIATDATTVTEAALFRGAVPEAAVPEAADAVYGAGPGEADGDREPEPEADGALAAEAAGADDDELPLDSGESAEGEAVWTDVTAEVPAETAPEANAATAEDALPDARVDAAAEEPQEPEEPQVETRDLSGWMDLTLLRQLLGSEPTELDPAELKGDLLVKILVQDAEGPCEVALYARDGKLYWYDPAARALRLATVSPRQLLDFLG